MVDFRAQILVVKKYLTLLSRAHPRDPVLGQSRPRRAQRGRREDLALGRRDARARHRLRRRQPCDRRHAVHGVPVVGRPAGQGAPRRPASRAAAAGCNDWIWVHHAPPANSPTSWGGKRFFGDVELVQWIERYQPSMVISGHVHQSPFIPDGSWFDRLGEPGCSTPGCSPDARRSTSCSISTMATAFWLAAGDEQCHRSRRRRCSGRPHRSNIRRRGSYPWVGLPIRSWRDLHRRQVDHALQESRRPSRDGCRGRHIAA